MAVGLLATKMPFFDAKTAHHCLMFCQNPADGGPELDQHWVNVSCLLGVLTGHICVLHITGCEDIKTVAQLIEPKDDLVTVDHLPGKS